MSEENTPYNPDQGLLVAPAKPELKKPRQFRVLLVNDDYTTMEFVVMVLESVFYKTREEAIRIMLHVHQKGRGLCGVFPHEIAESKVQQVLDAARDSEHPLQCTLEPE